MTAKEVREKYLNFFKNSPRNHKEIAPAPLVLENDATTLFTSAGMQPLIPYLKGESHPQGKRLVDSQPSLRLQDIDEVGDSTHTTFFEMLGNWSLGDYFKAEQIPWIYEFFTKVLKLEKDRIYVSVFEGNKDVPKDEESFNIWKKLGIPEDRIYFYGVDKNWWSRTGEPKNMPVGEIGGPDSEIFYEFPQIKHNKKYGEKCHPNCPCGHYLEIGNCVFIQYEKSGENSLKELPQKNVDFGGGLERITAAVLDEPDIFQIDIYKLTIQRFESITFVEYANFPKNFRIIADHLRASKALIKNGVMPSNKLHGYILRRLIRRLAINLNELNKNISKDELQILIKNPVILNEIEKFKVTLEKGLRVAEKEWELLKNNPQEAQALADDIWKYYKKTFGEIASNYPMNSLTSVVAGTLALSEVTTYGIPAEETINMISKNVPGTNKEIMENVVKEGIKSHKELSRTTSAGIFKGGLADHSPQVVKLHTATHLLLAALRRVLGEHVVQKGQNITAERARFDFPNPEKLTEEQIQKIEENINNIIDMDLPVNFKVLLKSEALKTGATHAFNEKYTDTVKVYYVGKNLDEAVSKEFCGGPHVRSTREIGRVKIKKQEKIGAGLIRIYMGLDK